MCSTPPQTDGLTCSKSFLTKVMMPSTMITLAPYMDCCECTHHTHTQRGNIQQQTRVTSCSIVRLSRANGPFGAPHLDTRTPVNQLITAHYTLRRPSKEFAVPMNVITLFCCTYECHYNLQYTLLWSVCWSHKQALLPFSLPLTSSVSQPLGHSQRHLEGGGQTWGWRGQGKPSLFEGGWGGQTCRQT